jgi:hypothetical protein
MKTQKGKQCQRETIKQNKFCWQHRKQSGGAAEATETTRTGARGQPLSGVRGARGQPMIMVQGNKGQPTPIECCPCNPKAKAVSDFFSNLPAVLGQGAHLVSSVGETTKTVGETAKLFKKPK